MKAQREQQAASARALLVTTCPHRRWADECPICVADEWDQYAEDQGDHDAHQHAVLTTDRYDGDPSDEAAA